MTESAIQKQITEALKLKGYMVFRMNSGMARKNVKLCPAGTPDLLALGPGNMFWIEVKTETGRLRPEQASMHVKLERLGQTVLIARRVEDVLNYINKLVI